MDRSPHFYLTEIHLDLRDPCLHLLTLQLDDPPFKEMYVNSYNLISYKVELTLVEKYHEVY